MDDRGQTIRITCTHDCPDACSALVTVEDGVATDIRADASHPVTGRHLCVKVDRYLERVYSPDRVLTPLRRVGPKGGTDFEPISWEAALDEIVSRWQEVIAADGPLAILPYSYLGSMGVLDAFGPMFGLFTTMGASDLDRDICGGQSLALDMAVGNPTVDPETLPDARLIIAWGIDVVSTSIHTWDLIRAAKKNGARFIAIDPYRSRTARHADEHVRIRPGTDGALALGLAHVIVAEGLVDQEFVAEHTSGFDEFTAAIEPWTPEATAAATGLEPQVITDLARAYATTQPAAIRYGVGMQRAAGSGMAIRAIQCLPAITGQWRHRGGGIANASTMVGLGMWALWGSPPPGPKRSFNMVQLGQALTDPTLEPAIRALYVWNSNPAVIAADQTRVLEGLARDDLFTVVHDQFLTDTARYADIVLPAPTMLEHEELVGSWGFNYVSKNPAAIAPLGESRSNAEVARLLGRRMGFDDELFGLSDEDMIRACLDQSPFGAEVAFDRLEHEGFVPVEHPGGEVPHAAGFSGPSGRFELSSEALDATFGLGPLPRFIPPNESPETDPTLAERFPLRLLTLKRHHSINSSYGGLPVMRGAEPEGLVELHPTDAAAKGIADASLVRVWNDRGEVHGTARVTDDVLAGTIVVPFGRWLDGAPGANALTSDKLGDMGGGPTFCDALVDVGPAT
jgi:anaerobic selenocysteine-containing dehydrogenase